MTRARDVADTQDNRGGSVSPFVAAKNKVINGDFGIWQRGTSFSAAAGGNTWTADRFYTGRNGSGATVTVSRQAFTPGNAISGYEPQHFYRFTQSVAGSGATYTNLMATAIEGVRTFAGQTVTVSFWAKADTARTLNIGVGQYYGAGGSGTNYVQTNTFNVTTTWQRFSGTFTMPTVAGTTINDSNFLELFFQPGTLNVTQTWDFWGVQMEAGAVATPFTTATGTFQGEEEACQRYYQRITATSTFGRFGLGMATGSTNCQVVFPLKTTMRTSVTALDFSGTNHFVCNDGVSNTATNAAPTLDSMQNPNNCLVIFSVASGLTQFRPYNIAGNNNASAFIGFSAEL